jgi:hypothetical protein
VDHRLRLQRDRRHFAGAICFWHLPHPLTLDLAKDRVDRDDHREELRELPDDRGAQPGVGTALDKGTHMRPEALDAHDSGVVVDVIPNVPGPCLCPHATPFVSNSQ